MASLFSACTDYYPGDNYVPSLSPYFLDTEVRSLNFSSEASSQQFNVTSMSTPWKMTGQAAWLTVSPTSGNNDAKVNVGVSENLSADEVRSCVLTLSSTSPGYDRSVPISVTQEKAEPYITHNHEDTEVYMPATGGTKTVDIMANVAYTASVNYSTSSNRTWLTVKISEDYKSIQLEVVGNSTAESRTAFIVLSGGTTTDRICVIQYPAGITPTQTDTIQADQKGGTYFVEVEADAYWTATNNGYSWIEISPDNAKGGKTKVSLNVAPNNTTSSRTGSVSFRIGTTTVLTLRIEQQGLHLNVSPTTLSFEADAGSRDLMVESNVAWEVFSKPSWLTVTPENATGNKTLSVSVPDYNETSSRKGELVLGVQGLSLRCIIPVEQKGRTFPNLVDNLHFDAKVGSQPFTVQTDGAWTVASSESWLTLSQTSGKGNASIDAVVKENTTESERTARITVQVGKTTQTILVSQDAYYLTISPTSFAEMLPSTGGKYKVSIATNATWQASKKAAWLSLSATQGTGDIDVTMTAADNASINDRRDTVWFRPAYAQDVRVIVQQAARYLRVQSREIDFFYMGGESAPVQIETDGTYRITKEGDWFTIMETDGAFTVIATENTTGDKRQGKVIISLTDLAEGQSKTIEIPVVQRSNSSGIDRDGFSEDEDWNVVIGDSHATITIVKFGNDEDWNIKPGGSEFKVTVTGFDEDIDWNKLIQ